MVMSLRLPKISVLKKVPKVCQEMNSEEMCHIRLQSWGTEPPIKARFPYSYRVHLQVRTELEYRFWAAFK